MHLFVESFTSTWHCYVYIFVYMYTPVKGDVDDCNVDEKVKLAKVSGIAFAGGNTSSAGSKCFEVLQ